MKSRLGPVPQRQPAEGAARYAQPMKAQLAPRNDHAKKSRVTFFLSVKAQEHLAALLRDLRKMRVTVTNDAGKVQSRKPSASMLVDFAIIALDASIAERLLSGHNDEPDIT